MWNVHGMSAYQRNKTIPISQSMVNVQSPFENLFSFFDGTLLLNSTCLILFYYYLI